MSRLPVMFDGVYRPERKQSASARAGPKHCKMASVAYRRGLLPTDLEGRVVETPRGILSVG